MRSTNDDTGHTPRDVVNPRAQRAQADSPRPDVRFKLFLAHSP